jgi:hypothetical protein
MRVTDFSDFSGTAGADVFAAHFAGFGAYFPASIALGRACRGW